MPSWGQKLGPHLFFERRRKALSLGHSLGQSLGQPRSRMASRYESIVNADGVACEFTQALRAKSWYYIGMSRAMLTARRRAAAEVDGGGMQLAGGISRAYIATLKTREQANEIIVSSCLGMPTALLSKCN